MPTSARKSSVGRDSLAGSHRPYRGNNPTIGRKTGIIVKDTQRADDGFEPFESILSQADMRTPPKVKGRRKKRKSPSPVDEEDEDEEEDDNDKTQDMELDSPVKYFTNTAPQTTSNGSRSGSRRPVRASAEIDFDEVPSPSSLRRSRRKSMANGSAAGPSTLSSSFNASDMEISNDEDSDHQPNGTKNGANSSFLAMGQEDNDVNDDDLPPSPDFDHIGDDDVQATSPLAHRGKGKGRAPSPIEEEDEPETPAPNRNKGKGRATSEPASPQSPEQEQEQDMDVEPDIDAGLQDVENQPPQSDEEEEPEQPVKKRARKNDSSKKSENRQVVPRGDEGSLRSPSGVRRSQRHRYAPLEWWRLEKVLYGKREGGPTLVPQIKEIVRVPKEEPKPLGSKNKRKRSAAPRGKSVAKERAGTSDEPVALNPEEGWDDETPDTAPVLDFVTQKEVVRRLALTAKSITPRQAANADWLFQKVFGDGEFVAAGHLIIPPGSRKPSKPTRDNTYVFYVIEGAVNLKVHNSSLVLATGGMFMVPRGNTYFIENIADRDAKLFFTQARKIEADDETDRTSSAVGRRSSELRIEGTPASRGGSTVAGAGDKPESRKGLKRPTARS